MSTLHYVASTHGGAHITIDGTGVGFVENVPLARKLVERYSALAGVQDAEKVKQLLDCIARRDGGDALAAAADAVRADIQREVTP
ncbi:MAG: hypothetical protein GY856_36880 [bacterium]|nr:hypothetical protein [bacterium]